VKSALRLAGFHGTLDDFCLLQPEERSRHLAHAPHYALFIDEINRGNVARILGELITLLETDKRLGAENELIVTLPYSGTRFGVPSNLHVIGTMNTADRSLEALDAALRRRFEFEELPPRPELLDFTIEGDVDPAALLRTINRRLEVLRDRDHVIGHAYLLDLKDDPTLDALKHAFKCRILPLLQEYFFGDWGKIGLVLGRMFVRKRELSAVQLADFDHDERDALGERATWEMVDVKDLTNVAFRSVYERADDR
jgi:5-methylcytosine-specific restriction protein B